MKFIDKYHQVFYEECIGKTNSHKDPYRKALFYTLGLTEDTRRHINDVYDFKEKGIEFEGLNKAWQTSTTMRVTRLAFNLYNGFNGEFDEDNRIDRPDMYTPDNLFCCDLTPYFFEAVKIRYPEYYHEINANQQELPRNRVWLYARLANGGDNPCDLLNSQLISLITYAKENNMQIVGITQEIGSGLNYKRAGLNEVLTAAMADRMDTLLMKNYDRLGRDMLKTMDFADNINSLGVKVETIFDNNISDISKEVAGLFRNFADNIDKVNSEDDELEH